MSRLDRGEPWASLCWLGVGLLEMFPAQPFHDDVAGAWAAAARCDMTPGSCTCGWHRTQLAGYGMSPQSNEVVE